MRHDTLLSEGPPNQWVLDSGVVGAQTARGAASYISRIVVREERLCEAFAVDRLRCLLLTLWQTDVARCIRQCG